MGTQGLTEQELLSVKNSFVNILTLFLREENIESKYVGCLIKWAVQLQFEGSDLRNVETNFNKLAFNMPDTPAEKLDAIFDLVHMIYLDNIVEDIELEIASKYAEQLGFQKHTVGEIFQSLELGSITGKDLPTIKEDLRTILRNSGLN